MKDPAGTLLFVARGTSRQGSFEEGKPWERLRGFSKHNAEELYYTRQQLELLRHFANKSLGTKLALSGGAHVLLAEFDDNVALHLNCADATPVEIDRLHVTLIREFIRSREELVGNICSIAFEWRVEDDKVVTYDPARPGWARSAEAGVPCGRTRLDRRRSRGGCTGGFRFVAARCVSARHLRFISQSR
jgi:hypothetical protein